MNFQESEAARKVAISLRRGTIWYLDKFSYFAESGVVLVGGFIALAILYLAKIGGPNDWAAYAVSFVLIAVGVYVSRRLGHQNAILIEATLSYLIDGGRHLLDELLGKLISGQWRREHLKPGDALFRVLEKISYGKDWQLKRRIAEALPALGEIDRRKALNIADALRYDWDDYWHSDLRRRVLEALVIPPFIGAAPLMDRMRQEQLRSFLVLRERDQIYVALAAAEAISTLNVGDEKFANELRQDLAQYGANHFSAEENEAIEALFKLFDITKGKQPDSTAAKLVEMSQSKNFFVRIVAARNLLIISERLPETTLGLMTRFLDRNQPDNVRRPIAREQCVRFLTGMTKNIAYQRAAEELLLCLVTDSDTIIRITAFDLIDLVRDQADLHAKLCKVVIENEESLGSDAAQDLLDRARLAQSRPTPSTQKT